jgi:hypothetical protein
LIKHYVLSGVKDTENLVSVNYILLGTFTKEKTLVTVKEYLFPKLKLKERPFSINQKYLSIENSTK